MGADAPGFVRADAAPGDDNFGKPIPCPECYAPKMARLARDNGQLDGELLVNTFDNFHTTDTNRAAYNAAREFADNPTGWLTLYPDYGGGKSHLCAAIANQLGKKCRYFNTPDLTSSLKDFDKTEKIISDISRTPVIILDELDKAHVSSWTREQLQRIFDHRYRNAATIGLVIATNIAPEQFDGPLQFIGERMRDDRFKCVEVRGNNRGFVSKLRSKMQR